MSPRIGLVATVRGTGRRLGTYVDHYLALGVSPIYLFFDDPEDDSIIFTEGRRGVVSVPVTDAIKAQWRSCGSFPKIAAFTAREVMARQVLNLELAIGMAQDDGVDWLIHLDDDEKLVPALPLADLLAAVPSAVDQVYLANDEGVPERDDAEDPFVDVTLFRRNPILAPPTAIDCYVARTGRADYFLAYSNGKSCARVARGLVPAGAHAFASGAGPLNSAILYGATLQHHPYWSLASYLQKARHRRNEPATYFDAAPVAFPFQLLTGEAARAGDTERLRRYFHELVMLTDRALISELIADGALYRSP